MKKIVLVIAALFLLSGIGYSSIIKNDDSVKTRHKADVKIKKPLPRYLGAYTYGGVEYNFEGASTGNPAITGVFYISGGVQIYLPPSAFPGGTWAPPVGSGISFVTVTVNSPTGIFSLSQDIF